ncbi:MAG TPA: class I SAM-dependent methyltransferase [Chitinophagaceae bacterium]|nr:class I SAM-dependent methyltransferase [Chitinophagaceae bacterium]
MKRVNIDDMDFAMEDFLYHLTRYKYIARLIRKNWNLLEVGCGTGYGSNFLADYCATINACELDKQVLDAAKTRFKKANLTYSYEPANNSYDCVVCLEVIEHMSKGEGDELLKFIYGKMKNKGVSFISTPRKIDNPSENRKKYHIYEYTYEDLTASLEKVFDNVLVLSQTDELIGTQNKNTAWNYFAICFKS